MLFSTTKNYGLFVLRTCILLNGGAIIALLAAVTHQSDAVVIALGFVRFSIVLLVFGLVCAVVAAVFAYLNFERGQSTLSDAKMKRYRNIALACAALSLAFFCAAAIIAVFSVNEAPLSLRMGVSSCGLPICFGNWRFVHRKSRDD